MQSSSDQATGDEKSQTTRQSGPQEKPDVQSGPQEEPDVPSVIYLYRCRTGLITFPRRQTSSEYEYLGAYALGRGTMWELDKYIAQRTGSSGLEVHQISQDQFERYHAAWSAGLSWKPSAVL